MRKIGTHYSHRQNKVERTTIFHRQQLLHLDGGGGDVAMTVPDSDTSDRQMTVNSWLTELVCLSFSSSPPSFYVGQ